MGQLKHPLTPIEHRKVLEKTFAEWTKVDLENMVAYYRDLREKYNLEEKSKAATKEDNLSKAVGQKL